MTSYDKVIFTRSGDLPLADFAGPRLTWRAALEDPQTFTSTVERIVQGSLDRHDQALAEEGRPHFALAPNPRAFHLNPEMWELAYHGDRVVGLSQPILYVDTDRDGRPQGTIHYIGVIESERGRGYINELLWRATAVLLARNVWRILCDTDVENAPMIAAFELAGYTRGRVRNVPFDWEP